jgi:hypothetical protein
MKNNWCETCGYEHGPLYICQHYSEERKKEIADKADKLRADMMNPEWVRKQLDNGVPLEAIAIMAAFMGLRLEVEKK